MFSNYYYFYKVLSSKIFPKSCKKIYPLTNIITIINNILFYGLWALFCSFYTQYCFNKSGSVFRDFLTFTISSCSFVAVLIWLEFIRLRKNEFDLTLSIENPFYILFSLMIFQVSFTKPYLLELFISL